jgi:hypothetical protein
MRVISENEITPEKVGTTNSSHSNASKRWKEESIFRPFHSPGMGNSTSKMAQMSTLSQLWQAFCFTLV